MLLKSLALVQPTTVAQASDALVEFGDRAKTYAGGARSCDVSPQGDVGHQIQRLDIVVDASADVGDRYPPATSSSATTTIPQCMGLRSLCFGKRQAAKNWAFLVRLFELS